MKRKTTPVKPPFTGDFTRYWLQWSGGNAEKALRPDGSLPFWDWVSAAETDVNKMHIIFSCRDENGRKISGVPDPASLERRCKVCAYELEESHKAGIRIIAYSDDVQFEAATMERMGLTLDDIAYLRDGQVIIDKAWNPRGSYIACINAPAWRKWMRQNLRIYAEAGYDGLQLDYHPYSAGGYFCTCRHCKEGWAARSTERFGGLRKPPHGSFDFTEEVDREYYLWRMECLNDFLKYVFDGALEVNPRFESLMNDNAFSSSFAFQALGRSVNAATSEFWGRNCGFDSTLYLNQITEAFGYRELNTIINDCGQTAEEWQYKTILAESFSTIGGVTQHRPFYETGRRIMHFAKEHPSVYADTSSLAKVAVLYSTESEALTVPTGVATGYSLTGERSRSREANRLLLSAGIVHDYIVLEREWALDALKEYDAFVIPAYNYFNDAVWRPILEALSASGKPVIVLMAEDTEARSDYAVSHLGKGFTICAAADDTEALTSALGAFNVVTSLNNRRSAQITARTDGDKAYVHVTQIGGPEMLEDASQQFAFRIPSDMTVRDVEAFAPFHDDPSLHIEWKVQDGLLIAATGAFDTYAVVAVAFE
ncbi:MAG: hypothetical protein MJ192_04485 [Clostridia bacterium]|nr:hypothetical protein [Clostridia bacterium]